MVYKIGETVEYVSGDCEPLMSNKLGKIVEVASDKYDEIRIGKDALEYWSKKTKSWREVKEKDIPSIYYTVTNPAGLYPEFIETHMIVGKSPRSAT